MKKLFEFKCSHCNHYFEELTEYTKTYECPKCGKEADKIISSPNFYLEGITGSFPGAAMNWEKKHRDKLAEEKKKQE
jgi:putative FmdB family regulatory protein